MSLIYSVYSLDVILDKNEKIIFEIEKGRDGWRDKGEYGMRSLLGVT